MKLKKYKTNLRFEIDFNKFFIKMINVIIISFIIFNLKIT